MHTYWKNAAKFVSGFRKCLFTCVAVLSIFLFSGCSSSLTSTDNVSQTSDVTNATLHVLVWADEYDYMSAVAEAYNAISNGVTVQISPASNDSYEENLESLLAYSTYDLVGTKGIAKTVQLSTKGLLLDITDYVKSSIANGSIDISSYGNMFNDITYDGRYYAFPTRTTCWALFYNKDLFDQAGISYPKQMTWDEYADLAMSLTDPNRGIYGGYFLPWLPSCIALQSGSYLTDDDLSPLRNSLAYLNMLYTSGSHVSFHEMEEVEDPSEDVYNIFESGRIAMVPNGEWMVNILSSDAALGKTSTNWDIAPMPISPGQEDNTTWGQYQYIGICSSTNYPDAAYDFLSFLCGKRGAEIYAANSIISAYSDSDTITSYLQASGHESARYFFEARKIQEQLPIWGYQEMIVSCRSVSDAYFAGTITLDEALSQFSSDRTAIYENNE